MDAPVLGADTNPYPEANTWDTFISYRYQKSDRHFNGPHEQSFTDPATGRKIEQVRIKEGTQVINYLNLIDLSARYNLSSRSSVTVSMPYVMIERSQTINGTRDPETLLRPVIDRYSTHATGLSDITVSYRRWMLDPETHKKGNFSLGVGLKIPTGSSSVHDSFKTYDAATKTFGRDVRPVDQSIQPGDGGFGFILDGSMFLRFGAGNVGWYTSGTYLFNPQEEYELNRGNSGISEHLSISDQYILRFGLGAKMSDHFGANLGMRLEGVPSEDAIGGSRGMRRPGRAWSVEPSLSWSGGNNSLTVGVPFAVYRNRQFNVADREAGREEPGDAAFADWLLMISWGHHFGGGAKKN